MRSERSKRGFVFVMGRTHGRGEATRIVSESSAIGEYEDALEKPGSSFLWVGQGHHLNREEVAELVERMQHWLATGRLAVDE